MAVDLLTFFRRREQQTVKPAMLFPRDFHLGMLLGARPNIAFTSHLQVKQMPLQCSFHKVLRDYQDNLVSNYAGHEINFKTNLMSDRGKMIET